MIDVIIPVYRGLEATRRAIESVLASRDATPREIVVIDDASPEPEVAQYVAGLAARGEVTLLRNESNAGFVRSVNRGMSAHPDRDVVLLNSDTEVVNDWLARIAAHAAADSQIATITPFSNNATICSYPFEGWQDGVPGTLGLVRLDQLIAQTHRGTSIDIPTGVGFCMYVRRAALTQLGLFDAERFGRGYGEENDFCMKAGKAGWRNVLACDLFVYHEGSVSFAEDRFALMDVAAKALVEAHPDYPRKVREWIMRDPAGEVRSAIDVARSRVSLEEAEAVVAERLQERQRIVHGLWHLEQISEDRQSRIGQLHLGLEHASSLLTERDQTIARLEAGVRDAKEEIVRLRAGLAHAESLAFAREAELQRVYNSRRWRYMHRLSRLLALARRRGSA